MLKQWNFVSPQSETLDYNLIEVLSPLKQQVYSSVAIIIHTMMLIETVAH